jgi:hypothetical protein
MDLPSYFTSGNFTASPIHIFPHYTSSKPMQIHLEEKYLPSLHGNFIATDAATGAELLNVNREVFSISSRTHITNATTTSPIYTIRTQIGTMPPAFSFVCPAGNTFLQLRGEFFLPHIEPKAVAYVEDAATGAGEELSMTGNWKNTHAEIVRKGTGEVVARVTSDF